MHLLFQWFCFACKPSQKVGYPIIQHKHEIVKLSFFDTKTIFQQLFQNNSNNKLFV